MKWEAVMPAKDAASEQKTLTVEAKNWLAALNASLEKMGEPAVVASNLKCDVRENGAVSVTDFRTRRVFLLKPENQRPASVSVLPEPGQSFLESKSTGRRSAVPQASQPAAPAPAAQAAEAGPSQGPDRPALDAPPTPPALLDHRIFFARDENPTPQSNLVYRERLIVATGPSSREAVESLLLYYFETLRRSIVQIDGARYVNLAVYAAEFKGQPPVPPLGALSWQDWKDSTPHVVFPAVEPPVAQAAAALPAVVPDDPSAATVRIPEKAGTGVEVEADRAPTVPVKPRPSASPAPAPQPRPASQAPQPQPQAQPVSQAPQQDVAQPPQAAPRPRKGTPVREVQAGRDFEVADPGEILAQVFEEMQDLFLTQNQDDAASFVLGIAVKKIPAEAGSVFLADINTRELYFAAVHGPTADKLKGQRLHMTKGLVGFAARQGATIALPDVRQDPRFCDEFDQSTSFVTKSVMCSPIQYEGRTYGAIEILNRKGGGTFTEAEVSVVSYMARQLAEFIATSLPSVDTDLDPDEKKPATQAPRASISGAGKGKPKPKVKGRK